MSEKTNVTIPHKAHTELGPQILNIQHVCKNFDMPGGQKLRAVNDVSFHLSAGEKMAIVGESGCGKSTLVKLVTRIEDVTKGDILFAGEKINDIKGEALRQYRKQVQMVFQDPKAVFSPRMKIGQFLMEPWINFEKKSKKEAKENAYYSLERVHLGPEYFNKYPHQLSGGELQRVAIARAISLHPRLLICDEATSALDVSIQRQILDLLQEHFEQAHGDQAFSILFITHDLALAENFCDRIVVMYLGTVVETMRAHVLKYHAQHPYTQALLKSVFSIYSDQNEPITVLKGEPPSPVDLPEGCVFSGRCPYATELCYKEKPKLKNFRPGHYVACHRELTETHL